MEPPEQAWSEPPRARLVLDEGIEAGLVGGLAVAAVFLAWDLWAGDPMRTPAVLGALLVAGAEGTRGDGPAAGSAALYHAIHFFVWVALGFVASDLMKRAERSGARWIPAVAAVVAVASLAALDLWVQRAGLERLHLWVGGLVGIATMGAFLAWRHPGALRAPPAGKRSAQRGPAREPLAGAERRPEPERGC